MKKIIIALAMIVMIVSVVNAEVSGSLSTKVLPKYVNGDGVIFYDKPVVWTNLFIGSSNGLYVDLWDSKGFSGQNYGNEIDLDGGYAKDGLEIGMAYWNITPVTTLNKSDMVSPQPAFIATDP